MKPLNVSTKVIIVWFGLCMGTANGFARLASSAATPFIINKRHVSPETNHKKNFLLHNDDNNNNKNNNKRDHGRVHLSSSEPIMGLTENLSPTFIDTGSHCLNLFFDVVPGIGREHLHTLLDKAWEEDPDTTVKLIFQLGDPREGKANRKNLYPALLWLHERDFETLLVNLDLLPQFSCYKSLLDLLQLVCVGSDALDDKRHHPDTFEARVEQRRATHQAKLEDFFLEILSEKEKRDWPVHRLTGVGWNRPIWRDSDLRDRFVEYALKKDQETSRSARVRRRKRNLVSLLRAQETYQSNTNFRRLYDKVADIFASALKEEKERLEQQGRGHISGLAPKWAPSLKGSHDRHTNIVDGIAARLFTEYSSPDAVDAKIPSFWDIRERYRQEYLSPLRRAAEIPESFIGSASWSLVNYKRMPSRCRLVHGHIYQRHDTERYQAYLAEAREQVVSGENITMISAGALLPHELMGRVCEDRDESIDLESGLQWLRLVQDIKEQGNLPSAVAVCDVSGSMYGLPMEVSIALSTLVSDVSEGPWKNKLITFSQTPSLHTVPAATEDNLRDRYLGVRGMEWGANTDFQAVFDLLLDSAKFFNVSPADMPQTLFCFSDMEFDQAHEGDWKTDVELIREKYAESGYKVPELIFWNLRPSRSKPVSYDEPGVALLSGFSAGMLKSFLAYRMDDFTPQAEMLRSLKPYESVRLYDTDVDDSSNNKPTSDVVATGMSENLREEEDALSRLQEDLTVQRALAEVQKFRVNESEEPLSSLLVFDDDEETRTTSLVEQLEKSLAQRDFKQACELLAKL